MCFSQRGNTKTLGDSTDAQGDAAPSDQADATSATSTGGATEFFFELGIGVLPLIIVYSDGKTGYLFGSKT